MASAAADFKAAHMAETLWGFGTLRHALSPATLELLLHHVSQAEASLQLPTLPCHAFHHDPFECCQRNGISREVQRCGAL